MNQSGSEGASLGRVELSDFFVHCAEAVGDGLADADQ